MKLLNEPSVPLELWVPLQPSQTLSTHFNSSFLVQKTSIANAPDPLNPKSPPCSESFPCPPLLSEEMNV